MHVTECYYSLSLQREILVCFHYLFLLPTEDDYSGLPATLTFSEAGPECFDVGITQDNLLEGTENFYLVLATRDDDIIFDIRSAIIYIIDNNSMLSTYEL